MLYMGVDYEEEDPNC